MSRQPDEFSQYHQAIRELIEEQSKEISELREAVQKSKNGIWRMIATGAIGIIVSGSGFWIAFGQNAITEDTMRQHVADTVKPINDRVLESREDIRHMKTVIEDNGKAIERLKARTNTR